MSFPFLSTTDPEWPRMWDALADLTGDYAECNPDNGEVWQYMGTVRRDRPAIGSTLPLSVVVHQFRHRHRPAGARPIGSFLGRHDDCRVYLDIIASHKFAPGNHPLGGQANRLHVEFYQD